MQEEISKEEALWRIAEMKRLIPATQSPDMDTQGGCKLDYLARHIMNE